MKDLTNLRRLSESLDYQVAADSHDIRGWRVLSEAGTELGTVTDLLYDPATTEVEYAMVAVDGFKRLVAVADLGFQEGADHVVLRERRPAATFEAAQPSAAELAHRELVEGNPPDELPPMRRDSDYLPG